MGKSRADVVMVTENDLYGIEIKSDADTYTRLSRQVKDYDKYFDYNYVVAGSSHALHIREHVPSYWGVITVELVNGEFDFYILRKPEKNPKVSWKKKTELLWRPELVLLQEWHKMPKYKEKSKVFVINKILERLDNGKIKEEVLKREISELIMQRDYNNISAVLQEYREENLKKNVRNRK